MNMKWKYMIGRQYPLMDREKMNEPDHPYAEFDWITT